MCTIQYSAVTEKQKAKRALGSRLAINLCPVLNIYI